MRLLVDHRERLVAQRTALINDLRWGLHDLWPEFEIPPRALTGPRWQGASPAGSRAPIRAPACGSRATSCAASAS